jgi:tellurite resistance protein TerC
MHAPAHLFFWLLFLAFVVLALLLDLKLFHRHPRAIGLREALFTSALWIALAAAFALTIFFCGDRMTGTAHAANARLSIEFITAYLVEESLSIDNLFLFLLIFRYFKTPSELQHTVLFWGILGAILMRAVFIATGVTLLHRLPWISYLFGAIVVYSGITLLFQQDESRNPATSPLARFAQRHLRLTGDYSGANFTVRRNGRLFFTTLALVLLVVETTDLLFAADSIPAVLAISRQPYIVFTSNVFAVLGLRSLYFALAALINFFGKLHYALAAILLLVGVKMLASHFIEIPTLYTFAITVAALAAGILASAKSRPKA